MLLTRWVSISRKASSMSKRSDRQQDGRHAARRLHELVHAGAMRQRRDHQRGILLRGAGHEISEMVGHHEGHLAMGQHRRLGTPGGARGEEEPAGIVILDRGILDPRARMRRDCFAHRGLAERALADPPGEGERRACAARCRMVRKIAMTQEALGAGGRREIGRLRPASAGNWSAPRPRPAGRRRTSTRTSRRNSWNGQGSGRL